MTYEQKVLTELAQWEAEMTEEPWLLEKLSRKVQRRVDKWIPEKIHQTFAKAMETAVKSVMAGIEMLPFSESKLRQYQNLSLVEKDFYFKDLLSRYKKIAAAEGIGTGAGGILLAAVDYPALLTIKLKFLSETAQIYGYDIRVFAERLFLLKVFQLAFSGDLSRQRVFQQIRDWDGEKQLFLADIGVEGAVSWREFYTEYRESIEFKKLLSFIPLVGAAVNGWANFSLLDELGITASNSYRMRILKQKTG
ncbi:EcsC family protein [Effusibacillus lacus]|uniref:ABC transporter-associated protein EcsC n=1 Tax=Effusibacillus lacus TaxID=1348429 RepID=A0A292YRF0_9BACL|nr:EcsC family protein [Effusibacillus lacus]TCS75841.1 EcsC family protein [Effusibacillus lacus]GAX91766.1 ABC transporter-associated protein EcsC [Effusibacillus lacus]